MSGYRPSGGGDIVEPPIDSTLAISTEGASFSYVEATGTVTSTLDGITISFKYCYDTGHKAAGKLLPAMLCQGYARSMADFDTTFMRRVASYVDPDSGRAPLVFAVDSRGRDSVSGTVDYMRDRYDRLDALLAVVAAVGASYVHGDSGACCVPIGYSTGALDAALFACSFPDHVYEHGGPVMIWPNYDLLTYYAIQSEDQRAYMNTWLGNPRTGDPTIVAKYLAANPIDALEKLVAGVRGLEPWVICDADDPLAVPLPPHAELISALRSSADGVRRTHVDESTSASAVRYQHNAGLSAASTIYLERLFWPYVLRRAAEWQLARTWRGRVLGFLETRAVAGAADPGDNRPGFELWLGANADTKAHSSGGVGHFADVEVIDAGRQYRIDSPQSGHVLVRRGLEKRKAAITGGTPLLVNLYEAPTITDPTDLDATHWWKAGDNTTESGGLVSAWGDKIGALSADEATNKPTLTTAGGKSVIRFTAGSSTKLVISQLIVNPKAAFTIGVVCSTSATSAYFLALSHHGTRAELALRRNSNLQATYLLDAVGTQGLESANGIGGATFSIAAPHCLLLRRYLDEDGAWRMAVSIDGSEWYSRSPATNPASSEVLSDAFTTTGTNTTSFGAGWADGAPDYWQFLSGDIYEVVTADEAWGESYGAAYLAYCVSTYGITL